MKEEIRERIEMINKGQVPEGYKQTKVGIIPEDWEVKRLGEIAEIGSSKRIMAHEYVPEGIPFYRSKEIIEKSLGNKIEERLYISRERYQEIASQFPIPQEGEILITAVGTLGIPYLIRRRDLPFYFKDGNLIWFREIQDVNKEYLIYLWLSEAIIRQIENTFSGSSQKALTIEKVNKLKFPNAPLPEQEKIAQILSTWDKAIELKEKLIKEKKERKKGLMQKLLTGEVRLPGFTGEWEEGKFDEIFSRISSRRYQVKTKDYLENGLYPIVDQGKKKVIAYSNAREKVFKVKSDGVIVFGDHTREFKFIDFDFVVGADGTQLLTTMEEYDIKFYYYHMLIKRIPDTGYNRHFKFLKDMTFNLPPLEEQKAIANVLSTADKEIDLLNEELEQLKEQKKGLMQLLLTGKIRVDLEQ